MSRRFPSAVALAALVIVNGYAGLVKIQAFRHGFSGSRAVARADLNQAYSSLRSSLRWQPDNSSHNVLVARVVATAQANGLPLEALAGRSTLEILGVGVGAAGRGIAVNPDDAWTWFNLAEVYLGHRSSRIRLERMLRAGRAAGAAAAAPEPQPAAAALGPEDRLAVAAVLKARELEPNFFFYHSFLAGLYWERGLQAEAGGEIRRAMALMPRDDLQPVLERPGLLPALAGPILEGLALAASDPFFDPAGVARVRAEVLQRLGRFEEGVEAAREFCRLGGDAVAAECRLALGRLLALQGRMDQAVEEFERAATSDPRGDLGATALYEQGSVLARTGDHARAAEVLASFVARQPAHLGGSLSLAEELEALGRFDEAEACLVAAVRKFPDALQVYERIVEFLRRRGKLDQAALYAEALLRRRSESARPRRPAATTPGGFAAPAP